MKFTAKSAVAVLAVVASQAAHAAAPSLPASSALHYTGVIAETGYACNVDVSTNDLAWPVSVRLEVPENLKLGNVGLMEATFDYNPLVPGAALAVPTADGFSVKKGNLSGALVELIDVEFIGNDARALTALSFTRSFPGVLGATLKCDNLVAK